MNGELLALSNDDIRRELLHSCNSAGGQTAWANKHDLSQSSVSQTIAGIREPSESIINALGYSKVTRYVRMVRKAAA